ncbi:MAG: M23 family metallopeptidase, partial [Myxococcales bacterium]|nr:M23 family metallopeptidase [Myxococcales bacterium]
HLDKVLVHKNQFVSRGDSLALAGKSGFRTKPALYFEVREDGRAVDPYLYLRR